MMSMEAETQARADQAGAEKPQQDIRAWRDFSQLATATTMVAELLCESIDLRPGQTVLDVATGSGNAALAAARRGCEPRGIDLVPALLQRARERARAERLRACFQWGHAEAIPFPDESFDVVLSVFGVMFMPDQLRATTELLRVCRSGGKIGLANWAADGFIGAILQGAAHHNPPVPGWPDAATWGSECGLHALFGERVRSLEVSRRGFTYRCRSPEYFLELFLTYYCSTLPALQVLDGTGRDALAQTLIAVVRRFNRTVGGGMIALADYLEVVAIKR